MKHSPSATTCHLNTRSSANWVVLKFLVELGLGDLHARTSANWVGVKRDVALFNGQADARSSANSVVVKLQKSGCVQILMHEVVQIKKTDL